MKLVGIAIVGAILAAHTSFVIEAEDNPASGIRISYLGNAGYQIEDGKKVILVDVNTVRSLLKEFLCRRSFLD